MKKQNLLKKTFEENFEDDLYNIDSSEDNSEDKFGTKTQTNKQNNSGKRSRKISNSRISATTKDGHSINGSMANQQDSQNLVLLVDSLKEKISLFENEIRNLIDEKIEMQLTINNLQISQTNNTKNNNKQNGNKKLSSESEIKNTESAVDLNKHYIQEASGLNKELKNLQINIERQKQLLEQNCSILDECTLDNFQITEIEGNNNSSNTCTGNFLSKLNLNNKSENITQIYDGNATKNSLSIQEIQNLGLQRESIINEIKNLKEELLSLMEMQKNIVNDVQQYEINNLKVNSSNILNEEIANSNLIEKFILSSRSNKLNRSQDNINNILNPIKLNANTKDYINQSNSNILLNISNPNVSTNNTENLPNIEQFFVFNNKFSLVDSDKNLWHLKKCRKCDEFTKFNSHNFNSKEENLFAFLEYYQSFQKDDRENDNTKNTNNNINNNSNINNNTNCNTVNNSCDKFNSRNQNNLTTHYSDQNKITENQEMINMDDGVEEEEVVDLNKELNNDNSYDLSDSN